MSATHDHKVNKLYSHVRSVEERKPIDTEIGPIGLVKNRHVDEKTKQVIRNRKEFMALLDKHQEQRNNDPMTRNGSAPHEMTVHRENEERDALDAKHKKIMDRLKLRHHGELEAVVKMHGAK